MVDNLRVTLPEVEYVDPRLLRFDGENPNKMSKSQRAALRKSLVRWGFIIPIITNKDLLVADGQQRAEEALAMHLPHVPVVRLPVEDVDRRLLRQVLNKLKGQHDAVLDAHEFQRIIAAGEETRLKQLIDVSDSQIEQLLQHLRKPKAEAFTVSNEVETGIQRGDVYQLGNHRLMCGDATDLHDVATLLDDQAAELFFLDPPYGMPFPEALFNGYRSRCNTIVYMNSDRESVKNAAQSPSFRYFLIGRRYYSGIPSTHLPLIHHTLIGVYQETTRFTPLDPPFSSFIPFFVKPGSFEKNPYFMERVLYAYTGRGDGVVDLFGGKGNMLITCHEHQRRCHIMDIVPTCCQTMVDRWEAYTGLTAEKVLGGG
jgi:hypothetical protein